jgi:phosphate/sulfate permease
MSPAEGFATQAAAVVSIGLADGGGVPVSTTQVITSGAAGSSVSNGNSLNRQTLGRIALTWVTTLPGCVMASFVGAMVLHIALV